MDVEAPRGLRRVFGDMEDPRVERTRLHRLSDILTIALCGVICGADSWTEIELFGKAKFDWLRTFLGLPHGIPSHDTFGRVTWIPERSTPNHAVNDCDALKDSPGGTKSQRNSASVRYRALAVPFTVAPLDPSRSVHGAGMTARGLVYPTPVSTFVHGERRVT